MRLTLLIPLLFSISTYAAETNSDTFKINVATQTYQCTVNNQSLKCNPINQVEQKVLDLKKNDGKIQVADNAKGLSFDLATSLNNGNIIYDITMCSNTACTVNTIYSGSNGAINQIMLGQYNITESSFFVLGVSLSSQNQILNISEKIQSLIKH